MKRWTMRVDAWAESLNDLTDDESPTRYEGEVRWQLSNDIDITIYIFHGYDFSIRTSDILTSINVSSGTHAWFLNPCDPDYEETLDRIDAELGISDIRDMIREAQVTLKSLALDDWYDKKRKAGY